MHGILIQGCCWWLPVPVSQFGDQVSLGEYWGTVLPMSPDSFSPCTARAWDLCRSQLGLVQFLAMISGCRLLGATHGNCSTQQASLYNCTIYKWLSYLLQALFLGRSSYIYTAICLISFCFSYQPSINAKHGGKQLAQFRYVTRMSTCCYDFVSMCIQIHMFQNWSWIVVKDCLQQHD
jgi:hypothetical protein